MKRASPAPHYKAEQATTHPLLLVLPPNLCSFPGQWCSCRCVCTALLGHSTSMSWSRAEVFYLCAAGKRYVHRVVSVHRSLAILIKQQSITEEYCLRVPLVGEACQLQTITEIVQHIACFYENIYYLPFQHFLQFWDVMAERFFSNSFMRLFSVLWEIS